MSDSISQVYLALAAEPQEFENEINKFFKKNKITRERLIDIKFQIDGVWQYALIVYERLEEKK